MDDYKSTFYTMTAWHCGIMGCAETYQSVDAVVRHQLTDHQSRECQVCGTLVPAGFGAIKHAFDNHTRAEYVRAYDASSDDIRYREDLKEFIEDTVDLTEIYPPDEDVNPQVASAGD